MAAISELFEGLFWEHSQAEISAVFRGFSARYLRIISLRQKIKKFLDDRGEANTTEILEHVNSTMRHGTTPQQLGNVLSKDKDIMKVSTTKRGGALSGRYEICVWQLRPGALEEN